MLWVALLILVSLDLSASQHEYVRLLKPPSRIAENDVFIKRNAESPCPTIKTIKGTISQKVFFDFLKFNIADIIITPLNVLRTVLL